MNQEVFPEPRFRISGDRMLLVVLGEAIDLSINERVRALTELLRREPPDGVLVIWPSYCSLAILYDPLVTHPSALKTLVRHKAENLDKAHIPPPRTVEIPVCYGGEFGPDIGFVAEHNGLSVQDVVAIHIARPYHIYTIGFAPGFCYLGGLDQRLHTPRMETPRTLVPAGSVGIAEAQTGIYPLDSPGGWRLIGRTPVNIFNARREQPFLYQAGDSLQFVEISAETYWRKLEEESP